MLRRALVAAFCLGAVMAAGLWLLEGGAGEAGPPPVAPEVGLEPRTEEPARALLPAAVPEPVVDQLHERDVAPPDLEARQRLPTADPDTLSALRRRHLAFPVPGVDLATLRDDFNDPRTGHAHEALDILAPRGAQVVAVDDGTVAKLFTSVRGGLTVYHFDPGQDYSYYYAHLDRYARGLVEGKTLARGEVIGYVGTTGNAPPDTPHLHFAIFELGPGKEWWKGTPLNPFPVWRQSSFSPR